MECETKHSPAHLPRSSHTDLELIFLAHELGAGMVTHFYQSGTVC